MSHVAVGTLSNHEVVNFNIDCGLTGVRISESRTGSTGRHVHRLQGSAGGHCHGSGSGGSSSFHSLEVENDGASTTVATVGEYTNVSALPRVLAPVPQTGDISGMTSLSYGNPLRNQALYIPTGKALWVTIYGAASDNATNCPYVGVQGGFF